jgi:hypothetical protein
MASKAISEADMARYNVRYIARLLGVPACKVAESIVREVQMVRGEVKTGLVTVNGEARLVPCAADGKVRMSVADIRRIWNIRAGETIRIGS